MRRPSLACRVDPLATQGGEKTLSIPVSPWRRGTAGRDGNR